VWFTGVVLIYAPPRIVSMKNTVMKIDFSAQLPSHRPKSGAEVYKFFARRSTILIGA